MTAAALEAQPTVSVSPTSLTFSTVLNGSAASQSMTVNNAGSATYAVFANSSPQWLKVNGGTSASGNTPATVTVTADPTGLATGNFTGTLVVVGSTGSPVNVPVTLTVSSIGVTPSPVTFAYQQNGNAFQTQNLTLSASQSLTYTAVFNAASGGNWLTVPANGTAPGTLSVSLNTQVVGPSLAAGTYNGTITITPGNGSPAVNVPAVLTVTAAPNVTANPTTVNLNYQVGGATGATNTPAATLTLTNPGAQDLSYLISPASSPAGWLVASPSSGTIPANGSVQINVSYQTSANLTPGTYTGQLTVFIPGSALGQLIVPVRLLVSTAPLLNVPGSTLSFTYQIGGSAPASKTVTATSSAVAADATSGQMPLIITATTATGGSWLTVPQTGVTGTAITVSVNPANLAVGTYNGTISITGVGAANNPQTIPVTLTVSNDPLIVASFGGCSTSSVACAMLFPIQTGQNNTLTQNIRVQSSTGAQASFSATVAMTPSADCGTSWLASGVTTQQLSNDTTFPITVTPGSIASGKTCTGTVTITGINPSTGLPLPNSPVVIPVTMYVSSSAMLAANPIALNFSLNLNGSASQNFNVTSTSATDQLAFTVSTPGTAPWLLAGPNPRNTTAGQNNVIVAVNAAGLAPGTYTSAVTVTASGSGVLDSPLTIPVTLTLNGATMSVTPASLSFTQTLGGQIPATKTLTVSTSSTDIAFTVTANMATGAGWLSVTPPSATATQATPGTVTVAANGTNLAPGTYNGTVTITSLSAFTTNGTVSIPVTFEVKGGTVSATPASLTFTQVQNGTLPAAQKISVAGTPGALAFTVGASITGNGNWLSVSPTSGTTPADINVSVNSGTLAPGTYTGKVTITSTGATGSPLDVPVTLTVTAAQTISISTSTVNFTYVAGSTNTPSAQNVQVTSSGTGVTFTTATTVSGGGNWLTVSPTSGTAPATLAIAVNPTGLAAGTYTGTIAINSPSAATQPAASIAVTLTVQSIPKPVINAVANAASYVNGPVSPGENIVIFGTGIGPATLTVAALSNNAFPTTVANTQVFFDNTPAPILYARADQTSVMVPYGVAGRPTTSIRVVYQGVTSDAVTYNVVGSAPGIYTLNQAGSGQGAILNVTATTATVNAAANPAAKGSVVAIYMTGEGATSPTGPDGGVAPINGTGLFKPVLPVTASVGGIPATVLYYGSAPGIIYGVMQVNVQIPDTVAAGSNVPIVITVGGNSTQTGTSQVTLAVQ